MSSYVVSDEHIHVLVSAALHRGKSYGSPFSWYSVTDGWKTLHPDNATATGQMLLNANYKAVNERYNDEEGEPHEYTYREPRTTYPNVAILKAINAFAYQASDAADFEQSEANAFLNALTQAIIRKLPGYDEAPWSFD